MSQRQFMSLSSIIVLTIFLLSGCDNTAPPISISYSKSIQPIFNQHCLECHDTNGAGSIASGLTLSTYQALMKGTKFGPVIKPGDSLSSTIVILVEGRADPTIKMPHGDRPSLSNIQIKSLRQWIDQGANNN